MSGAPAELRSGLGPIGTIRVSGTGLAARRLRATLSALGVAIGIAALVAVLAMSASSRAEIVGRLGRYGNLLTVASGQTIGGTPTPLPDTAPAMITRIPSVRAVSAIGLVPGATVRRTAVIPETDTGGIAVVAADTGLLAAIDGRLAHGTFLNGATAHYPAVVLGASAARLLGVADLMHPQQVHIGGKDVTVVGILEPLTIAPEIDQTAMLGFPAAASLLDFDGAATRLYIRSDPDQVSAVRHVLARTTNPQSPEAADVSLPSELLAARETARTTFGALYLGLGAVALLVGGVGIANVMVISVLERRSEIGLRRALGATRGQIGAQFLVEAIILSAAGGLVGTALGVAAAAIAAQIQGWPLTVPGVARWGGVAAAVAVGAVAGLYPAARAARLAPTEALRSV